MRVVKLGGRAQESADVGAAVAAVWRDSGGQLCVIHGGGEAISRLQRAAGVEPVFLGGRRVTTAEDLDVVRMALSGLANKRLVSMLQTHDVPAWGISGEDASLLKALPLPAEFGLAGIPTAVNVPVIRLLLDAGHLPVISPVARHAIGSGALNVNGDDAAAAFAAALQAEELLFVSDVAGVLASSGDVIARLDSCDAAALIAAGEAGAGMAAKLEAAVAALGRGVARVRVGDLSALRDSGAGTLITPPFVEALV